MKKETVFGVDIDQVLRDLLTNMVTSYNKYFNTNLKVEDVKDFVVENSFPEIEKQVGMRASEWFFRKNGHLMFRESDIIKGADEALARLRKHGKVILITYQKTLFNKLDTLNWLDDYGIEYDGICFVKDKSIVHVDYLIDDNDWNFVGANAEYGVLITAPYNAEKDTADILKTSNCNTMMRFDSLADFVNWIEAE